MKLKRHKSSIIPAGEIEKAQKEGQKEFLREQEKEIFDDPLIPWWTKVAIAISPVPLHTGTRTPTWCKRCGRKHSKLKRCEVLRLTEDLTHPPTKKDKEGNPIPNRKVGFYTTMPKEAAA